MTYIKELENEITVKRNADALKDQNDLKTGFCVNTNTKKTRSVFCKVYHCLLLSVASLSITSGANASNSPYADVFDRSIYDQEEVLRSMPNTYTESQINRRLEEHFLEAKRERLDHHCAGRMLERREQLQENFSLARERENLRDTTGILSNGLGGRVLAAALIHILGREVLDSAYHVGDSNQIFMEIERINSRMVDLHDGLEREPMLPLEIKYIRQKRKMKNEPLKEQIEEKLLALRRVEGFVFGFTSRYVEEALRLPLEKRCLFDTSVPRGLRQLLERIHSNRYIRNYDPVTKSLLERIIIDLATISSRTHPNQRRVYYFSGEPSAGKTNAAKQIFSVLGVTPLIVSVQGPDDISTANLKGQEYFMPQGRPGLIAKTLMQTEEGGQPILNAGLILDDIDRALFNGNSVEPRVHNFLLSFFDPKTETYHNDYFGVNLPINSLIVIMTANQSMVETVETQALRSRTTQIIEFPRLPEEFIASSANNKLEEERNNFSVLDRFKFRYVDACTVRVTFDNSNLNVPPAVLSHLFNQLACNISEDNLSFDIPTGIAQDARETTTIRELTETGRLSLAVTEFMAQLVRLSDEITQQAAENRSVEGLTVNQLYAQAAICGSPEACQILGNSATAEGRAWLERKESLTSSRNSQNATPARPNNTDSNIPEGGANNNYLQVPACSETSVESGVPSPHQPMRNISNVSNNEHSANNSVSSLARLWENRISSGESAAQASNPAGPRNPSVGATSRPFRTQNRSVANIEHNTRPQERGLSRRSTGVNPPRVNNNRSLSQRPTLNQIDLLATHARNYVRVVFPLTYQLLRLTIGAALEAYEHFRTNVLPQLLRSSKS